MQGSPLQRQSTTRFSVDDGKGGHLFAARCRPARCQPVILKAIRGVSLLG